MKDINDIMPKPPGFQLGLLILCQTYQSPTLEQLIGMMKTLPRDKKWHSVIEEKDQVHVDGKRIWKKKENSWT